MTELTPTSEARIVIAIDGETHVLPIHWDETLCLYPSYGTVPDPEEQTTAVTCSLCCDELADLVEKWS